MCGSNPARASDGEVVARTILLGAFGLIAAGANIAFWMFVVVRGQQRWQRWVERVFNVVIHVSHKGHWRVSGSVSWLWRLALELLQLAYFLIAFLVWAIALLLTAGLFSLVGR
jgi:hypothetical protein